jgi:hypothetical protein
MSLKLIKLFSAPFAALTLFVLSDVSLAAEKSVAKDCRQ